MLFSDLRNDQIRQVIDAEQAFSGYRSARGELDARFAGSMSWKTIAGGSYLYRKVHGASRSLGPKSPETEGIYENFRDGRARQRDLVRGLAARLDEMAPVNRALGIGRVPLIGARVLRQLDGSGLLGRALHVVGTNALYAYERMAGVRIDSGLVATGDVDLLLDARRALKIAAPGLSSEGLLGLLRKADTSFSLMGRRSFRAVNRDGFMVDLIKPALKDRLVGADRSSFGGDNDLHAVEIEGLAWLVNSPKQRVIVIDDRGYPLAMAVPDPRAFALHKAWLAARRDREPNKRQRDAAQAKLVAGMVKERLPNLRFDADDLSALPAALRRAAATLHVEQGDRDDGRLEPGW
ncbi:GSU2403 family nucleotidyltransferase fold protein [Methylorubrum aminovorans]